MPVSLVDLPPTLLGMAGLEAPPNLDGLDASSRFRQEANTSFADRFLYGEASGGRQQAIGLPGIYPIYRSVRQGRFKLIERQADGAAERMLFDLAADPGEVRDVAEQYPDQVAALAAELEQRHAEASAPAGAEIELDEEDLERLRALGYQP